jgi:signal transduction histidine kinase
MSRGSNDPWRDRVLSEREILLSEAERIVHMGSWVWDLRAGTIGWSDELFRIFGHEPGAFEPSLERFLGGLVEEDAEIIRQESAMVPSEGRIPGPRLARVRRPDGSTREVTFDGATVYDADGQPVRVVGTALDVSDLRSAERASQQALASLDDAQRLARMGSWRLDLATNKVEWSAGLYALLGIDPSEVPDIRHISQGIPADEMSRVWAWQLATLAGKPGTIEHRFVRADGQLRHLVVESAVKRDERGTISEITGTTMDVTERRALEAQLLRSQKMEALGRLAGGIAHDFNNLLTVITSNAQSLNRTYDLGAPISDIMEAADRASAMVRQLLAFARQIVINPRLIDLSATMTQASRLVTRLLGEQVHMTVEAEPGLWAIRADDTQMHQVIMNLAINARDAMPEGGQLRVRLANVVLGGQTVRNLIPGPAEGEHVMRAMADTGIGMDEATRGRAFEPFFTTKGPERGSGLGLATVFGIVTQSGGCLELDSAPGQGATFRIYFPRAPGPSPRDGGP